MSTNLIFQQIPKVMLEIDAISKNRNNASQGYKFRGIDDVYNELHPLLSKHKIFSTTNVVDQIRESKQSSKGGVLTYSILTIQFKFYAEDGSSVEVTTVGEGMDSGDKASNKAMAVAHKYALMQLFSIPTEDDKDPENYSPPIAAPKPQSRVETELKKIENHVAQASKAFNNPPQKNVTQVNTAVSEAQIKRLHAIASGNGWDNAAVKQILKERFNLESSKNLTRFQYDQLCNFLETNKSKGA